MAEESRIPLAPAVRWRRVRRELVPLACFALTVAACGMLWERRGGASHGVGEVEAQRVAVTSPTIGLVEAFPGDGRIWQAFDRVEAGEVLGRLRVGATSTEPGELVEIQAPVSGTLVALDCWPGQTLAVGGPIATIAADHGRHVVTYLSEADSTQLEPGMTVTVRPRGSGSRLSETQVEAVGRQIERVPLHHNGNPTAPQWGLPVRIRMPDEIDLRPGTLVDVVINNRQ